MRITNSEYLPSGTAVQSVDRQEVLIQPEPDFALNDDQFIEALFGGRVVAIPPIVVHMVGPAAALLFCQCLYWTRGNRSRTGNDDYSQRCKQGEFWNSVREVRRQTGLTKGAIQTAVARLEKKGWLKVRTERAARLPEITFWLVNKKRFADDVRAFSAMPACVSMGVLPDSGNTYSRIPANTITVGTESKGKKVRGAISEIAPFVSKDISGVLKELPSNPGAYVQSRKYAPPADRLSNEEMDARCREIASESNIVFPPASVEAFVNHHRRGPKPWTIRGDPIHCLRDALKGWCAKANGRATLDGQHEKECWTIAGELGLDDDAVQAFIDLQDRNRWIAENPATGLDEPIRDIKARLIPFCEQLEDCRYGMT
jgi:hypothetical protein